EWEGRHYLIPETRAAQAVRLYVADVFPYGWCLAGTLLRGDFADATLVRHDGRWWMFVLAGRDTLALYHADALEGPWRPHPASPIVDADASRARPGGRVVAHGGTLVRYAQDGVPLYGHRLRAFAVDVLAAGAYAEHEAE